MKPDELNATNLEIGFELNLIPGNVKAGMKNAGAGSRDLWQVPRSQIRTIENFNVRTPGPELDAHIANIGESILREGFYADRPLSGYVAKEDGEDVIYIYDGHCRLAAVDYALERGADLDRLPVVVSPGCDMEDLTVALVRMNQGKELKPFELGQVCKRLVRMGRTEPEVAARLGLSDQYVRGLLRLMTAPAEIREMVRRDEVSASVAIEIIGKHGEKALEVLQKAQERATGEGKGKVTPRHVDPADKMKKAAKARYADMFDALEKVAGIEIPAKGPIELPQAVFDEVYALMQEIRESGS